MWGRGKLKEQINQLKQQVESERHRADMYQLAYSESLEVIAKLRTKRKKRRNLSHRKGFRHLTEAESLEIYNEWSKGIDITELAHQFDVSNATVGRHIRKHYEEENNGQSMERVSESEDRTSKEEE